MMLHFKMELSVYRFMLLLFIVGGLPRSRLNGNSGGTYINVWILECLWRLQ